MKKVTGIGGIMYKVKSPKATCEWYSKHLGFNTDDYGTSFKWRESDSDEIGHTAWSPMSDNTDYMGSANQDFMINFRVENLSELLVHLEAEGIQQIGEVQEYEYGKFAHIIDLDGRKVELWQPYDTSYDAIADAQTP